MQALVVKFLRRFRILLQLLWNVHGSRSIWKPSINLALHLLVFDTSTTGLVLPLKKQSFTLDFSRCVTWIFTVTQLNFDDDLLWGFSVDVHQRTVQYRQSDLRQIRDCVSAGSVRLRMSGLKSRAHLIRKYTHPPDLISASLFTLANLYVQKGFAQQDVFSALRA